MNAPVTNLNIQMQFEAYLRSFISKSIGSSTTPFNTTIHPYFSESGKSISWIAYLHYPNSVKRFEFIQNDWAKGESGFSQIDSKCDWSKLNPSGDRKHALYNLNRIVDSKISVPVYFCADERESDFVTSIGLLATTCYTLLKHTSFTPLNGRHVIIAPSHFTNERELAGFNYTCQQLAQSLTSIGCKVSIIDSEQLGLKVSGSFHYWKESREFKGKKTTAADIQNLKVTPMPVSSNEELSLDEFFAKCGTVDERTVNDTLIRIGRHKSLKVVEHGATIGQISITEGQVVFAERDTNGSIVDLMFYSHDKTPAFLVGKHNGLISFNLKPDALTFITIDVITALKIAEAGLPVVLVPPTSIQPALVSSSQRFKACIKQLQAITKTINIPVPLHEKNDYIRLLNGSDAQLLDLPSPILVSDDAKAVKAYLVDESRKIANAWGELLPLSSFIESCSRDYPVDAFPPVIAAFIKAASKRVQTPLALAGQCTLATLAYIAQSQVLAKGHFGIEPCCLYIMTQGESGVRKSTMQKITDKVIREDEKRRRLLYMEAKANWDSQVKSKSKADREEFMVTNPEPKNPQAIFSEATIEAIVMAFIDKCITDGMFSADEAGMFFNSRSMSPETLALVLAILVKIWDDMKLERNRSKSNINGSGYADDIALTINLLGQNVVLKPALNNDLMRNQGFLARFLFASPDDLRGTRTQTFDEYQSNGADGMNDPAFTAFWDLCKAKLQSDLPLPLEKGVIPPRRTLIPIEPEANKIFWRLYNETEEKQAKGKEYEFLGQFAIRSDSNARRIATIFAFFNGQKTINAETAENACALARYSLSEWARFGDVETAEQSDAELLIGRWAKYCNRERVTSLDYSQAMGNRPSRLKKLKAPELQQLITQLEHANYLKVKNIPGSNSKRTIEISPVLLEKLAKQQS